MSATLPDTRSEVGGLNLSPHLSANAAIEKD
jgi:hypothetical protein